MFEFERLIRKFWDNRTTQAENKRLAQLLEQYEKLEPTIAQKGFSTEENDQVLHLSKDRALSLLQNIHRDLGLEDPAEKEGTHAQRDVREVRAGAVHRLVRRFAVAASVCLLAGSIFLLTGRHREDRPIVKNTAPALPRLMRVVNGSNTSMPVRLEDGSTVQLEKNSGISYYQPFINNRRDISLAGMALFKVAKDGARPFTVYAGEIATRALGTKFWVNAADPKKVTVQLLEGKVAVNAAPGTTTKTTINEVVLTPGQQFSFDRDSRHYAVNAIVPQPVRSPKQTPQDTQPELVFRKEPLGMVFKKVGKLYKTPMVFKQEELNDLYFTGTFLKSDNLNIVLSTICNVNNLLFTNEQDSIIITKQH
jgi:transmembrane sensor